MADFPSKVHTETGSPHSQDSSQGGSGLRGLAANVNIRGDMSFLRSITAILMMIEILLGMLHWALIASTLFVHTAAYGWVMFVAVTLWILTTLLFLLFLFSCHRHVSFIPWPLTMMMYNAIGAVLYLTAFATNAANVPTGFIYGGHLGAAAFFGAVVTLAYGAGAFFSYLDWRADGGNAASSTVPT